MSPEFAAFRNSPHSRLECVECHVAPGAAGWLASKTSGIRQLVESVMNSYPRPIPSALASNRLVPASETCETCHWPQKAAGVTLRVISKYAEDETNTRTQTVLMMRVGGNKIGGAVHGAHFGPGVRIRLALADPARQAILWIEYRNTKTGEIKPSPVPIPRLIPPRLCRNMICNVLIVIIGRQQLRTTGSSYGQGVLPEATLQEITVALHQKRKAWKC